MTKLQRLDVDFRRAPGAAPWAGPLLLAIAVAFASDVAVGYLKARARNAKDVAALARLDPRRLKPERNASAEEIAAARDTVQRLSTPWSKLFTALESAATDQVTLRSIEPDPKSGTVLISGEGKDYLATLSYVLGLGRVGTLSRVQLLRHEATADPAHRAVAFQISAAWKDGAQ